MIKLLLTSICLMVIPFCLLHSAKSVIGTQLEKTVGSEMAHSIADAQAMTATDLSDESQHALTTKQLENFRDFVLSDSSYVFDYKKRCLFVPQISYEIKDHPELKITVSIVCNQIKFESSTQTVIIDYDLVKKEFNRLNKNIINYKKQRKSDEASE